MKSSVKAARSSSAGKMSPVKAPPSSAAGNMSPVKMPSSAAGKRSSVKAPASSAAGKKAPSKSSPSAAAGRKSPVKASPSAKASPSKKGFSAGYSKAVGILSPRFSKSVPLNVFGSGCLAAPVNLGDIKDKSIKLHIKPVLPNFLGIYFTKAGETEVAAFMQPVFKSLDANPEKKLDMSIVGTFKRHTGDHVTPLPQSEKSEYAFEQLCMVMNIDMIDDPIERKKKVMPLIAHANSITTSKEHYKYPVSVKFGVDHGGTSYIPAMDQCFLDSDVLALAMASYKLNATELMKYDDIMAMMWTDVERGMQLMMNETGTFYDPAAEDRQAAKTAKKKTAQLEKSEDSGDDEDDEMDDDEEDDEDEDGEGDDSDDDYSEEGEEDGNDDDDDDDDNDNDHDDDDDHDDGNGEEEEEEEEEDEEDDE